MACQKKLVIPNTVQVRLIWSQNGRPANNVMHGLVNAGTPVDVNMANSISTGLSSLAASSGAESQMAATTFLVAVGVRDIRDVSFAEVISTAGGFVGLAADDGLPDQVALCLSIKTAKAGKAYRGRAYIPGWSESANGPSGHLTTVAKAAADAFAAGLIGVFAGAGLQLGVASRPVYSPEDCSIALPGFTTAATQVICRNDIWDTIRKRAGRT